MKKKMIPFLMLSLAAFFLCGCQKEQRPLCRIVTQVEITCDHNGLPISRRYTDDEKMQAVLLHLRLLHPAGIPDVDPEVVDADVYEIVVTLSNGQQRIYRQKDHRYFQKEDSCWQSIDPERASRLYTVMRYYNSDL